MLGPAPVGCAGDVFEGVVKVEGCHWPPFLREGVLVVVRLTSYSLPRSFVVR